MSLVYYHSILNAFIIFESDLESCLTFYYVTTKRGAKNAWVYLGEL
jgi:hypothetical protein